MAQKSILSFFKVPVYSKTSDSEKRKEAKAELKSSESGVGSDECSPVKKTNKRKVKCIESDDESEEIQNVNENNSKGIDTRLEENEKSVENVSTQKQEVKECTESVSKKPTKIIKIAKEVDEILLNESLNGGKLSVEDDQINNPKIKEDAFDNLKVVENGVKEDSLDEESKSPTKMEIDNLHTGEKNLIDGSKSTEISGASESRTVSEPSSSNHTVFIPRRKTARKSTIRPPAQCDWYVSKLKEQKDVQEINCVADVSKNDELSISEKLENETKKLKCEVTEISDNAEIDTGTQKSVHKTGDSKDLDNIEENSKLNSETKSSKQYTTKPSSDKKDKLNTEKSPNKMFVNTSEDSKKSGSNKNKPKRGQKKDAVSKNSSASIANFFITVKEKNENVSKEISKDVAEETCQNTDINEEKSTNNCDEVKKLETKIEMNESSELEQEDSPIKKGSKRGKKTQCIDSDDDEEVVSPKKADNEDENKSETTSKEVQNDNVSEEEKVSDEPPNEKSSATKAETEVNSKSKFGCKSTSSGTVYNPSKNRYHPIEDACWKQDEKVPYLALAKTMELIENITGRLKIIEILANFFRSVIVLSPNDLLQSVYLCLNRLAPEYEGIELGVGETLLMRAVAQATGRTFDKIKAEVAIKGDLGLVSENSRGSQRLMFSPPKLTVASVFSKFLEIAKMSGNAVMAKKIDKIQSLFVACRDCEAKYIIRSLSGKLRIGLAEQSVLSAIARAAVLTPPGQTYPPEIIDASKGILENSFKELLQSQTLILKTAYCECPNYDLIIPVLLKEGISALPKCCQLSPGRPLKPMLAHPTTGIDIVLERFDKNAFTCEFKYDGERAQIHMTDSGEVKIFSRNQEDNTSKYPDIISRLPNAVKESTKSFILDSEAVAWDKENHQILPFQVLSTRKRKDAVESEIVVQVCIMVFDLLYLNGESLIKKPLKERRSLLHSSFNAVENEFMFAQFKDGNSAETMQEFLDESVKGNCEGLMVKALEVDASYEIAKRSHNWLKLKKDYLQGVGDTIDLVVIGGYFGKGKRTGSYGGFLLACYDEDNEEFQSICKLGTGFKDDDLEAHSTFFKQHIISGPKSYYRYDHSLEPDVWFEAVQVWEIKCADLSISPVHKAAVGIVDPEKGVSLRFPRFVRIRDDKNSENATNSTQIADMYQKQEQIQNTSNKNNNAEEDFY